MRDGKFNIDYDAKKGFLKYETSSVGIAHTQGKRPKDEDDFCSVGIRFFNNRNEEIIAQLHGVFDGHGDDGKGAQFVGYYLY